MRRAGPSPRSFITRGLAEAYRAELVRAARRGLDFGPATGEPARWADRETAGVSWLEHASAYAVMKWPHAAAHTRASIADALATVTPALLAPAPSRPPAAVLRAALYGQAFRPAQPGASPSPQVTEALVLRLPVLRGAAPRGSRRAAPDRDGTGVGDDVPVKHLDAPPRPGGDRVVVGDDDDRRPGGVQLLQQGQDGGASGRVEVPSRLVGQQHRRTAGDRPGDRDPLPLAPRQLGRPGPGPVPQPDDSQGVCCQPPPLAAAHPAYSNPSATLPSTLWCSARKNCWNTNPIRDARSAASSRSRIRATSKPVTPTTPAVGLPRVPIRCSSVDLPDPDGPATATSSPAATARLA